MFDLVNYLYRQMGWSHKTFGPGDHVEGIIDHITKESAEIREKPQDLEEWVDVIILALDGAWRAGHIPENIAIMLERKQAKNMTRNWPDWRTVEPGKAIEHIREEVGIDHDFDGLFQQQDSWADDGGK